MARKLSITVRLDVEDIEALTRARATRRPFVVFLIEPLIHEFGNRIASVESVEYDRHQAR